MSLQVQSSQPPTSGRRTPQIYQNFGTSSAVSPTNGSNSNNKSASKLSLKASSSSDKQITSPSSSVESAKVENTPKENVKTLSPSKTESNQKAISPKKVDTEKEEKVTVTNGSTNGNHSEKQTNGKHESSPSVTTTASEETPKKTEEKEKKSKDSSKTSPRSTPQKQQLPESVKTADTPKTPVVDVGSKTEESPVTVMEVTPDQKKKKETVSEEKSLLTEKTFKGYTNEGEEMESLVVEPSEYEDSPMPPRTGGKTKLLKYSGAPLTRARISPFRIGDTAGNASTTVNLSTVSEGTSSAPASNETSPLDFNRPLRAISGRRATRPITDIQFTYRKSTQSNDSLSSLNVTVGSDIHNDSLRTPAPGSARKRKAMTPESTSDALVDIKDSCESPKRNRLDFSGFLGYMASPVTLIKNSLSRVKLHASTPVAKRSLHSDEELNVCVTAEATTTTANISGESAKMDVEESADEISKTPAEGTVGEGEQNVEESAKVGQTDIPEEQLSEDTTETPVEVKDVTNKQRQFCVVM